MSIGNSFNLRNHIIHVTQFAHAYRNSSAWALHDRYAKLTGLANLQDVTIEEVKRVTYDYYLQVFSGNLDITYKSSKYKTLSTNFYDY